MKQSRGELSPAQRELMDVVWERGGISASALRMILMEKRDVSRNTVRTLLERMEAKGWLKHREDGRTFLYSPARPREVSIAEKVRQVIDTVCGGSPEALVTALLEDRRLSDEELGRIRTMVNKAKKAKKAKDAAKG